MQVTMTTKGRDLLRPALPHSWICLYRWLVCIINQRSASLPLFDPGACVGTDCYGMFITDLVGGHLAQTMKRGIPHLVPPCSCFQGLSMIVSMIVSLHNLLFVQFPPRPSVSQNPTTVIYYNTSNLNACRLTIV